MRYFIYCRKSSEAEDRQVLSIESQLTTLQRTFASRADIEIVQIYQESFSAKAPGRALFSEMMKRIERGDAEGIVAWAPDRLARNSIDGGRIIYLLDCGVIRDLKFATYTFENNPQGKFMLQIMFGQSKYYSDALSENVKRGNRTKIEKGWRPSHAPLGYINDKNTKTIVADPVHFPLIQRMYELMLTGAYAPKTIALVARDQWGFTTPSRRQKGGVPLAMSTIYRILSNPFYAGIIVWNGQTYPGRHPAAVSLDQFNQVQELLGRPSRPRPQRHSFAFTGMIRCGGCGLMVTASRKTKPTGRRYTYYHCSRRRKIERCKQPAIGALELEAQFEQFLESLAISEAIQAQIIGEISQQFRQEHVHQQARERSLREATLSVEHQLEELFGLRLRNLIADEQFVEKRQALQLEKLRLEEALSKAAPVVRLEPAELLISFSKLAIFCFRNADDQTKRMIFETVGSNSMLTEKTLSIQAVKPFVSVGDADVFRRRLAFVEDVLTYSRQDDEHSRRIFENLKLIMGKTDRDEKLAS